MAKLLLIDDDTEVLDINKKYLSGEGFTVQTTADPALGIEYARKSKPDCILLDVMMPGMDGFQVCAEIRKFSSAPIIFLTGKDSEDDKINGLVTGGDDYIVKPYSLRELKARIDVILRRSQQIKPKQDTNILIFQNLTVDKLAHKAFFKGEDLLLANREYEVLLYLATHPNQEVTFEELGTALFGSYQENDRRSVMVNVSRLRKKMTIDYELENMIETVWSKGYKFITK
uniref:response regulator transcription factor n=1 Tax=Acetatifactor sp. TaxID=1872090 RepID=UPI00405773C8